MGSSVLERAWNDQSSWSQAADRLKGDLDRWRRLALGLAVLGAVLSAFAVVAGLDSATGKWLAFASGADDWGSQFTSRRWGDELKTLGIRSRPTMIGCPEHNGIKERFFGALKDEEVWPKEYDTRAEAIAAIDAWIDFYRSERPHQSLGYLTPAEHRTAPLASTRARTTA